MNWFKRLFGFKDKNEDLTFSSPMIIVNSPRLCLDGTFAKAALFEKIWIESNINNIYGVDKRLNDDDYIDYHLWEKQNREDLYEDYRPDNVPSFGSNTSLIFHGGCVSCTSQSNHGIDRCKGCRYFKGDWDKPNLSTYKKNIYSNQN